MVFRDRANSVIEDQLEHALSEFNFFFNSAMHNKLNQYPIVSQEVEQQMSPSVWWP